MTFSKMTLNFLITTTACVVLLAVQACDNSSDAVTAPTVTLKGGIPAIRNVQNKGSFVGDTDASLMNFTVYKFAVSASVDCSSPITIFTSEAGTQADMLSSPTFGSGSLAAGTYPCVMIEVSKIINTAAAVAQNSCTTTPFDDVICNDTQESETIDGTPVSCSGGISNDQHVTLFITTISAGTSGNNSLLPPADLSDTTSGLKLNSPFVVSADTTGTLTVDPVNFFDSNGRGTVCATHAPTFDFN